MGSNRWFEILDCYILQRYYTVRSKHLPSTSLDAITLLTDLMSSFASGEMGLRDLPRLKWHAGHWKSWSKGGKIDDMITEDG